MGTYERAIEQFNWLQPEFVVSVSDWIESYATNRKEMDERWNEFEDIIAPLQMPFFHVPGKQDINMPLMRKAWSGRRGPWDYHFRHTDVPFMVLHTEDAERRMPPNMERDMEIGNRIKNQSPEKALAFIRWDGRGAAAEGCAAANPNERGRTKTINTVRLIRTSLFVGALLALPVAARAEESAADLAQELTDPIADLVTLPIQMNLDRDIGPADDGTKLTTNVQPVIPFGASENWNLIARTIMPVIRQDDIFPGAGSRFGLGDINLTLFFSPKKPTAGGLIWGLAQSPFFRRQPTRCSAPRSGEQDPPRSG